MQLRRNLAHWGTFLAGREGPVLRVEPDPDDPDPNPLIGNLAGAIAHPCRIPQPMVRRGWLSRGPGADTSRGRDLYVPVSWSEALQLVAGELRRVHGSFGADAIFGGSYGWASAGRFHHAQSQLHRFLNVVMGGYVRSVNSYSAGASMVILPHILGSMEAVARRNVTWEQVAECSEVVIAFGGMALKNSRVAAGGVSRHVERAAMLRAAERGCKFICVSPLKRDLPIETEPHWIACRPGTDTALMLGIAHTLVTRGLHDAAFISKYCDGWDTFETYLRGAEDGQPKDIRWSERITGVPAGEIEKLALSLVGKRTLVVVSHSLQRAEHGEQPIWMGAVLACILGQVGFPGAGYAYALGTLAHYGRRTNIVGPAPFPQGKNGVQAFIPVARVSDMLLHPGETFAYNGEQYRYPDVRLCYWAGGNPFHHHQDLNRLAAAIGKLETFIVHELAWTATAKHADIVLPCTLTIERDDIGGTPIDPLLVAMHKEVEPYAQARDDYDIFSDLSALLGKRDEFTEGRSGTEWVRHLYDKTRDALAGQGFDAPTFEEFWERGEFELPQHPDDGGMFRAFRMAGVPLETPRGKIHVSSERIASFGYADCPGHPAWIEQQDAPTPTHPLMLIANQPATRLHSQLDFGGYSSSQKRSGREVCLINPVDAVPRGVGTGDIVRLYNERGACLASAEVSTDVMPGVVQLPTGAWYDPVWDHSGRPTCVHGNPNVLTRDVGTSSLAQGCSGQLTAIQIEKHGASPPPVRAFEGPPLETIR